MPLIWPFFAFGGIIAVIGMTGCQARKSIRGADGKLVIETLLFGLRVSSRSFEKSGASRHHQPVIPQQGGIQLEIRGAEGVLNLRSSYLSAADLQWLEKALLEMACS